MKTYHILYKHYKEEIFARSYITSTKGAVEALKEFEVLFPDAIFLTLSSEEVVNHISSRTSLEDKVRSSISTLDSHFLN